MAEKEIRIPPGAVIAVALGLGLAAVLGIAATAWAAPPPEGYVCPYCGAPFDTYDELVAHVQSEHPGERIPIHLVWM